MKTIKRIIITLMLCTFIATAVDLPIIGDNVIAQAATLKLKTKSLTLEVGEKKTLKISGTTGKVSWKSSKTSVATVSKKGTVTAFAAGNAKITATVSGKKFICSVTVNEPEYDFISNAPFTATQKEISNTSFVMPSDWTTSTPSEDDGSISVVLAPSDKVSSMHILISKTKEKDPDYLFLKGMFSTVLTKDYYTNLWKDNLGDMPFEISNFEQTDYEALFGKIFKVKYTITANDVLVNSVTYERYIDGYLVQIITLDADNLNMEAIADYIISSVVIK